MELNIEGKKALIIGAGHGIGFELANMLLEEQAEVCAVARKAKSLSRLQKKDTKSRLLTFNADLVPEETENVLLHFLKKQTFEPDILVHCMGARPCIPDGAPIHKIWRAWYRMLFELPLIFDEAFLPSMRKKRWGRIIHTGSVAALESQGPVTYCSFQAMRIAYVRSAGRKEAANGIVMSAVLPGAFTALGNRWDRLMSSEPDTAKMFVQQRIPVGRFGTADEIASFMLFLCSEKASFNAGGIYPVDGAQGTAFFQPME